MATFWNAAGEMRKVKEEFARCVGLEKHFEKTDIKKIGFYSTWLTFTMKLRPYSSVGYSIELIMQGSRVRASLWPLLRVLPPKCIKLRKHL